MEPENARPAEMDTDSRPTELVQFAKDLPFFVMETEQPKLSLPAKLTSLSPQQQLPPLQNALLGTVGVQQSMLLEFAQLALHLLQFLRELA